MQSVMTYILEARERGLNLVDAYLQYTTDIRKESQAPVSDAQLGSLQVELLNVVGRRLEHTLFCRAVVDAFITHLSVGQLQTLEAILPRLELDNYIDFEQVFWTYKEFFRIDTDAAIGKVLATNKAGQTLFEFLQTTVVKSS